MSSMILPFNDNDGATVTQRPVVLCILDGIGLGRQDECDAVHLANTPNLDKLMSSHPWGKLKAHGTAVGLPTDDDMGNSEVGHNAMGAGRIFAQGAKLVNNAFDSGAMWESPVWKRAIKPTPCTFWVLSDGNVHSHIKHLLQMIAQANVEGVQNVRIHILTDGRDVSPRSALDYIAPPKSTLNSMLPVETTKSPRVVVACGSHWIDMEQT